MYFFFPVIHMLKLSFRGKKRALPEQPSDILAEPNSGTLAQSERKVKKRVYTSFISKGQKDIETVHSAKRAETRICPVCEDTIPVRLLVSHEEFELQRVEEICRARLEDEDLVPWEQIEEEVLNAAGFAYPPTICSVCTDERYKDLADEVLRSKLVGPSIQETRAASPFLVLEWADRTFSPRCLKL